MIIHKSVMLNETLSFLKDTDKVIVDCTLGHAGHTLAMSAICPKAKIIGIDADEKMLNKAKQIIEEQGGDNIISIQGSYADIDTILKDNGEEKTDFILADLGVNLEHFMDSSRGFSIQGNADIDMRFDQKNELSAHEILNKYPQHKLSEIFIKYGDFTESKANELAKQITIDRKKQEIKTTFDFKQILNNLGLGKSACAVIFQSIRIETNQEIKNLETLLKKLPETLNLGGRCVIISYHSTEDRLTKYTFKDLEETGNFKILTKKAIQPHYKEVQANRAARSAKFRVIERTK